MVELWPAPEECGLPVASDILPRVEGWIEEVGGIEQAFKIVGTILLYSGPLQEIYDTYIDIADRNHTKAYDLLELSDKKYTLLDETEIGHRLGDYDGKGSSIYNHLKAIYIAKYEAISGKELTEDQIKQAQALASAEANLVMTHVSEMFAVAAQGDVETCVCGADLEKVFFTTELPALMNNKRITAINGVDIEKYRKIYFSGDEDAKYATFTLICKQELALMHERALSASGDKAEFLMDDYSTRRLFFEMEQNITAAKLRETAVEKMEETKATIEGSIPTRPAKAGKIIPIKKTASLR